ncbi:uncharacterized, partial [Tachysurus ichikawai]
DVFPHEHTLQLIADPSHSRSRSRSRSRSPHLARDGIFPSVWTLGQGHRQRDAEAAG